MVNETIPTTAAGFTQTAQSLLPKISGIGANIFQMVTWLIIIGIVIFAVSIFLFFYVQRKRYKYTLIIFEKIGDDWADTFIDKGMEMMFGDIGRILYLKKLKIYIPFPKYQSGQRRFYLKKRSDGMLENWRIRDDEDPDTVKKLRDSQAMLFHHTAINRGLEKEFNKQGWFKEYAPIIVSVVFIILIGVMTWLLFDKWITLAQTTNSGVDSAGKVLERADSILAKLDNLISHQTSGYVQKWILRLVT